LGRGFSLVLFEQPAAAREAKRRIEVDGFMVRVAGCLLRVAGCKLQVSG